KNTILFWHNSQKYLILPNQLGILEKNTHGTSLPMPQENELINIRFQYEGLISIQGRHKTRKIKKIWQEKKIPPWLRNNVPLLFYNNSFISAIGVFIINIKNKNKKRWSLSWINKIKHKKKDSFEFI
ncbi:tRNA lysidine(34) synthetase TilS, partial [Buchnera aphidicola]|nr:tRNA lysidine(34) synthetase TilS [Buchnera aphidicola]